MNDRRSGLETKEEERHGLKTRSERGGEGGKRLLLFIG